MKIINLENTTEEEYKKFDVRETARAIVLDNEGKVGVIYITGKDYIQIVGGGIEKDESIEEGLRRECLEEAGVEIEIVSKLCDVREVKKCDQQVQNSYCYIAKVVGDKGGTKFTKAETDYGFVIKWMELNELCQVHEESGFTNLFGEYAWTRSGYIIDEYKKTLK